MMNAIQLILSKQMSCAQAARYFNIPYSTLYNSYKIALSKQSENAKSSSEQNKQYEKHGYKKSWTQKNMRKAIKLVLTNQMYCHQAAICCDVPYTALYKATLSKQSKRIRSRKIKIEPSDEFDEPKLEELPKKVGHTRRRVWSQTNLQKALELVLSKQMLCHHAARFCDVPYTALYNSYKAALSKEPKTDELIKDGEQYDEDDDKPLIHCKEATKTEQSAEPRETEGNEAKLQNVRNDKILPDDIKSVDIEDKENKDDDKPLIHCKQPIKTEPYVDVEGIEENETPLQNIGIEKAYSDGPHFVDIEDEQSQDGVKTPTQCRQPIKIEPSMEVEEIEEIETPLQNIGIEKGDSDDTQFVDIEGEQSEDDANTLTQCKQPINIEPSMEVEEIEGSEGAQDITIDNTYSDGLEVINIEDEQSEDNTQPLIHCKQPVKIEESVEVEETEENEAPLKNIRIAKIFSNGLEFIDIEDTDYSN